MKNLQHYIALADLFRYPTEEYKGLVKHAQTLLELEYPEAAAMLQRFTQWVENSTMDHIEEVYTKTFHIQAICYLDFGYVVFGEDYKRGVFLANMVREQEMAGNDCGTDLADNLCNTLTLLPLLKDEEVLNDLVTRVIMPGLAMMLAEFKSARMELKTTIMKKKHNAILLEDMPNGNIYQDALNALLLVFEKDFGKIKAAADANMPAGSQSFINNCIPRAMSLNHQQNYMQ